MKILRLFTLLTCLLLLGNTGKAQWVSIPDTNFGKWLLYNGYGTCLQGDSIVGWEIDTTCADIVTTTIIDISGSPINDLTGIQYFDNLTVLNCSVSNLFSFPVLPPGLVTLDCSNITSGGFNVSFSTAVLPPALDTLRCLLSAIFQLPPLPAGLSYLDCGFNSSLSSLPALPAGLTYLNCNYTNLTTLPALPSGLIELNCAHSHLTALPALPLGLSKLDCTDNSITAMPALPATLRDLNCRENINLASLPALPAALSILNCGFTHITTLPQLPLGLRELKCDYANLSQLPTLRDSLRTLDCSMNDIATLPALPPNLEFLTCGRNNVITALPTLPASLRHLHFELTPLVTTMPALPSIMVYLNCRYTGITNLGPLPAALRTLVCSNLNLTAIPTLPSMLQLLICSSTNITGLPPLPASLSSLQVDSCIHLASLPELPNTMSLLNVSNTPSLLCLPPLKTIQYFYHSLAGFTCLPNYPQGNVASVPPLNTLPVCNLFNSNGCPVAYNIIGSTYNDANGNCVADSGELKVANMPVQLWQNGTMLEEFSSALAGSYTFNTTSYGTYQVTIDTAAIPFKIKCPASGSLTSVITALDSIDYNMDFAIECKGFDLEARSITPAGPLRPANYAPLEIAAGDASNFYNVFCSSGTGGTVVLNINGPAHYVSPAAGALTPTVNGNIITWNIPNFANVDFFEDFDIIIQTDTLAQLGQQICFVLGINANTPGETYTNNNTFTVCFPVINSYDPNDKAVYPAGNIDTTQRELVYTIRFQNTGNAEAQHIYLTDTLSSSINPASFQLLAYSHAPMVQLDGNRLRFNFPNINLPDSTTNEPASHGYVQFKVKLNNGLPVGTVINNTAFIYFDFNAPVVTNTTTNTITIPAPVLKPVSIGKYRIDRGVKPNGRL